MNSRKSLLNPLYCIRKDLILKFPRFVSDSVMLICKGSSLEGGGSWRLVLAGQGDVRTFGGFASLDEIKL